MIEEEIEKGAFDAYEKNSQLPKKYQIGDENWMDWFTKGAEYAEEKTSPKWYNVKEHLPERGTWCVVAWNGKPHLISLYIDNGLFIGDDNKATEYWLPVEFKQDETL